jgi:hypothetical protein
MAKLVYGLNVSLDGYVDHDAFGPDPTLFRHLIDRVRDTAGSLYGRRIYMRYWDEDQPGWGGAERDYAKAWRNQPKWVVSRTLISDDVEAVVRTLKAEHEGELEVAGTVLAQSLTDLGLIDAYPTPASDKARPADRHTPSGSRAA